MGLFDVWVDDGNQTIFEKCVELPEGDEIRLNDALNRMVARGKIESFGVSNHYPEVYTDSFESTLHAIKERLQT